MKEPQLTLEEYQLIVETLLFAAGTDVCAEWTSRQHQMMLDIAKKLNDESIKLNSIYLFEGGVFDEPAIAERLIKEFPNLSRNSIIVD